MTHKEVGEGGDDASDGMLQGIAPDERMRCSCRLEEEDEREASHGCDASPEEVISHLGEVVMLSEDHLKSFCL